MAGGDRGVVSWPARSAEFRDNVDVTVGIGSRLGCRAFNALYGLRIDGEDPAAQDDLAVSNLAIAGRAARADARGTTLPRSHRLAQPTSASSWSRGTTALCFARASTPSLHTPARSAK